MYNLEKIAAKRARKVIAVSDSMANFIKLKWGIDETKIEVIPNGYFESQVSTIFDKHLMEEKGLITFVGALSRWANIEKIIYAANYLRNEMAYFLIIGGGPSDYMKELKEHANELKLNNIKFMGSVPLNEAYEMIAKSEILLLPFPKSLCTYVANPIKVLEYMAFGKAMVLDGVSDIANFLNENNAALVCDYKNEMEFAENIRRLLRNSELRKEIGSNANILSKDFSWAMQGRRLAKLLCDIYEKL